MKKSSRKGEIILASAIIALLGAAAFLTMTRTDNPAVPQSLYPSEYECMGCRI
jgi:hypothetical protein